MIGTAVLYVHSEKRLKIYSEGGWQVEIRIPEVGWVIDHNDRDDGIMQPDEMRAVQWLRDVTKAIYRDQTTPSA